MRVIEGNWKEMMKKEKLHLKYNYIENKEINIIYRKESIGCDRDRVINCLKMRLKFIIASSSNHTHLI